MRNWWSALRERYDILRQVHARGHKLLFAQSFCFALAVPALVRLPLPRLNRLLSQAGRPRRDGNAEGDAIAATVLAMLRGGRPLVRSGCLIRGLTLYYFLRRSGVDVALCFGIGPGGGQDGFDGHCWLVLDGEPYLEARDPRPLYTTMYSFSGEAQ